MDNRSGTRKAGDYRIGWLYAGYLPDGVSLQQEVTCLLAVLENRADEALQDGFWNPSRL